MSGTPDKYHFRKNIDDIMSAPTNNFPPWRKYPIFPKQGTKPHYEVSEATDTDCSRSDKDT